MRKTKLVKAEELKFGDHFIYEDQEYIRCALSAGLRKADGYEDHCSTYSIEENILILINKEKDVLKIL